MLESFFAKIYKPLKVSWIRIVSEEVRNSSVVNPFVENILNPPQEEDADIQWSYDHVAAIIAKSKKVPVTNYLKFYNVLHWASLCYCNLQLPRYQQTTSTPSSIRCNLRISVIMCKVNLFTVKRVFFSSSSPNKIFFLFVIFIRFWKQFTCKQ